MQRGGPIRCCVSHGHHEQATGSGVKIRGAVANARTATARWRQGVAGDDHTGGCVARWWAGWRSGWVFSLAYIHMYMCRYIRTYIHTTFQRNVQRVEACWVLYTHTYTERACVNRLRWSGASLRAFLVENEFVLISTPACFHSRLHARAPCHIAPDAASMHYASIMETHHPLLHALHLPA